jgi:hypothetical protein
MTSKRFSWYRLPGRHAVLRVFVVAIKKGRVYTSMGIGLWDGPDV